MEQVQRHRKTVDKLVSTLKEQYFTLKNDITTKYLSKLSTNDINNVKDCFGVFDTNLKDFETGLADIETKFNQDDARDIEVKLNELKSNEFDAIMHEIDNSQSLNGAVAITKESSQPVEELEKFKQLGIKIKQAISAPVKRFSCLFLF